MFVAVACPQCGKPFQVEEPAVGRPAACPWCKQVVTALPVAEPAGAPSRPLSLDEAVQLPPAGTRPAPRGRLGPKLFVLAAVCVVVGVGTFLLARYGSGVVAGGAWREFAPPDGDCSVKLPADPVEEAVAADPRSPVTVGGKRFVARRWFERVTAEVGWLDLDREKARLARAGDVIDPERDRRAAALGGKAVKEGVAKFGTRDGREVQFETPGGPWVELYVFAPDGPHPRLYFVGVGGPNVAPDGPTARTVLDSFRLTR